jgi:hypothetical protein
MADDEKTQKLLDKLAKLKRHAESAEAIGSEAEAQAFATMFQKLLLDNKLEMTDLEFATSERVDPVDRSIINWRQYAIKVQRRRVEWMENLAQVTAEAYFCKILVGRGSNFIALVGRRQDRVIAEYMIVTLVRAVERLADEEYARFSTECVKQCARCWRYGTSVEKKNHTLQYRGLRHEFEPNWARCRGFRPTFIQSFIHRLMVRYHEVKTARVATSTALVRVKDSMKPVIEWIDDNIKKTALELSSKLGRNAEGARRGTAAANSIILDPRAMETTEAHKLKE